MKLPLEGIRVVEFVHMVMGPTCGLVLADLGAEVIKVEPVEGDNTRRLTGSGAGLFPALNRNKKSLAIDIRDPAGRDAVLKLVAGADVVTENFRPGAMDKIGFGYESLRGIKPHRARRSRADDGGARLHDGPAGPAAARRVFRERHHGRHVGCDRRAGCFE